MDSTQAQNSAILSGWKEIANYLGKGVRTVQRYEIELQLPVRRPSNHPRRGPVIAITVELDEWVKQAWRPREKVHSEAVHDLDLAPDFKPLQSSHP